MNIRAEVRSTHAAEGLPRRRFTVADVEAMVAAGLMDEGERTELIGGELVPMAAKGNRHKMVKAALLDRWYRARPDVARLVPETTFRLSEDTYFEPDVVIYDRAKGLRSLSGESVLLVVEIADYSPRYDTGRKAALYAGFGVRDLWVMTPCAWRRACSACPSPKGTARCATSPRRRRFCRRSHRTPSRCGWPL